MDNPAVELGDSRVDHQKIDRTRPVAALAFTVGQRGGMRLHDHPSGDERCR